MSSSKLPLPKPRQFRILALPLARLPRRTATHSSPSSSASSTTTSSSVSPVPALSPNSHADASPLPGKSSEPSSSVESSTKSPENSSGSSTPLLLFHVTQPSPSPSSGPPSLTSRALAKASDTWLKLGDKDPKSWTYWFYKKGEGLMDRIEYEEWALKAIHEGRDVKVVKKGEDKVQEMIEVSVEIPFIKPTIRDLPLPPLLPKLHRLLIHRIPYHRKMMWRSLLFTPVTFPFAIIPVVPNFPLFYVLWRAWSHYKAWRGAFYLEQLLKLGMIKEQPSKELDKVYASSGVVTAEKGSENKAPDATSSVKPPPPRSGTSRGEAPGVKSPKEEDARGLPSQAKGKGPAPDGTSTPSSMVYSVARGSGQSAPKQPGPPPAPRHPNLLLAPNQVPLLAKTFDIKGQELMDIIRAVEQADSRAWAADKKAAEASGEQSGSGGQSEKSEGGKKTGTNWRGNLHR